MLKTLFIKGFQSHKKTKIKLHKGVNVFFGRTDSGKSAIIRAIDLNIRNVKPKVKKLEFISKWASSVKIKIDKITRYRTKTKNQYLIAGESEPLSAVGTKVPDEVHNHFGFKDVNIHHQHDGHFLLSKTPGQVGRYLNEVVDLQIIDNSISKIKSKILSLNKEDSNIRYQIDKVKSELSTFDWIKNAEKRMVELKHVIKSMNDIEKVRLDINDCLWQINNIKFEENNLSNILSSDTKLTDVEKIEKEMMKILESSKMINELLEDYKATLDDITEIEYTISKIIKSLPKLCPYCKHPINKEEW